MNHVQSNIKQSASSVCLHIAVFLYVLPEVTILCSGAFSSAKRPQRTPIDTVSCCCAGSVDVLSQISSFSSNKQQREEDNRDSDTAGTKRYGCTANCLHSLFSKMCPFVASTGHLVHRTPTYNILKRKAKSLLLSRQVLALVT
jgi:hypothetical protein